jgi:hypothetical protein
VCFPPAQDIPCEMKYSPTVGSTEDRHLRIQWTPKVSCSELDSQATPSLGIIPKEEMGLLRVQSLSILETAAIMRIFVNRKDSVVVEDFFLVSSAWGQFLPPPVLRNWMFNLPTACIPCEFFVR